MHTPGPWVVGGESGNEGEAEVIATASGSRTIAWTASTFDASADDGFGADVITEEDRGNARLIAEAPALYFICKYLCALEDNDIHDADTRWKHVRQEMRKILERIGGASCTH